jgi:hypothetical protein
LERRVKIFRPNTQKDKSNLKGLLKKTEALIKLGDASKARESLNKGLSLSKNHSDFVALRAPLQELKKKQFQREQNELYAKMFKK